MANLKLKSIVELLKEEWELPEYKNSSESEQWCIDDAIIVGEILNASGDTFPYTGQKGWYEYYDSKNNLFFARLTYQPTKNPFFEFKLGWYKNNDQQTPVYDPSLPDNVTSLDVHKRSNTVAKIYRDEIIPFFLKQKMSDTIALQPISVSRYKFAIRMVKKFTPDELKIEEHPFKTILVKK